MTSWLHEQRLNAVQEVIASRGARSVLDLGCGTGDLLVRLVDDVQIRHVVGIDVDPASLERLRARLPRSGAGAACRVELALGSLISDTAHLSGFDCAVLVETIEHIDVDRLGHLERAVFRSMRPTTVVITTPNAEFNHLLGVPDHRFRHPDHRFEWDRARFRRWAQGAAARNGYDVSCSDVAGRHPEFGGASQMAVFDLQPAGPVSIAA